MNCKIIYQYFDILNRMSDKCISDLKKQGYSEYGVANALANQINNDNLKYEKVFQLGSMPIDTIENRIVFSMDINNGLIINVDLKNY